MISGTGTSFNGAADFHPRKRITEPGGLDNMMMLQWGRTLVSAETESDKYDVIGQFVLQWSHVLEDAETDIRGSSGKYGSRFN
jgi:hypothetical protein